MYFRSEDFGKDFKWGVSTAAYQSEGAYNIEGKGLSIWDVFSNTPGKIFNNQHGNTACDFYHRYAHDISLVKLMNIPNFRFSISWSRILPKGTGCINYRAVEFYNNVIDLCLEMGIEPWITLYHWDLPNELELKGGWTNREVINWFSEYVQRCVRTFGDRVKHWMVLNEPMVFTGAGYFLGVHAPGKKGLSNFLPSVHHAALCQAEGGRIIKSESSMHKAGTTFSCSYVEPFRSTSLDKIAAIKIDALLNRLFVEPLAGKGYPVEDLKLLERLEPYIKDGDESKLPFQMDFIGIQNYTRELVSYSAITPLIYAKLIAAEKRTTETTVMNWEIYPEALYKMIVQFSAYDFPSIIVTENGAAFDDRVEDGKIHDTRRKDYLQEHIAQVYRAVKQGMKVDGYFVWTLTDNFEWAEGYKPRFGLVHTDINTQKRIVKDSGRWYGNFLKTCKSSLLKEAIKFTEKIEP